MIDPVASLTWPHEFPGAYWLDQEEELAVLDVLRNGSLFRYYGVKPPRHVDAYEETSRSYYGAQYSLALNSATGGLIAALNALDIGPGCEVIIPSFLWVATVAAIIQVNAIPVICEVDNTFSLDPADLERKITPRTRLIMPIHMAGSPCDMDAIMAIAARHDIPVLEDCAQCNGGKYRGRSVGTFGRMGVFSLQLNKNITSGEGGLVITDDERLFLRAFSAHDMGMVRVQGRLAMPDPWAIAWGAGRRMCELCGAVATVQMSKLNQIVGAMRKSMRRISSLLADAPGLTLRRLNDADGDCGGFLILIFESDEIAAGVTQHVKAAGIHNAQHVRNYGLHIYSNIPSLVRKTPISAAGNPWTLSENSESVYAYDRGTCPRSDALFARSVLIPIPSCLTEQQEDQAARIIREGVKIAAASCCDGAGSRPLVT